MDINKEQQLIHDGSSPVVQPPHRIPSLPASTFSDVRFQARLQLCMLQSHKMTCSFMLPSFGTFFSLYPGVFFLFWTTCDIWARDCQCHKECQLVILQSSMVIKNIHWESLLSDGGILYFPKMAAFPAPCSFQSVTLILLL